MKLFLTRTMLGVVLAFSLGLWSVAHAETQIVNGPFMIAYDAARVSQNVCQGTIVQGTSRYTARWATSLFDCGGGQTLDADYIIANSGNGWRLGKKP